QIEILTYTSPGNIGGTRGKYTPEYWPVTSSQFGQLKKFSVDRDGVYIDNVLHHTKVTFEDLHLFDSDSIKFQIGVKQNAEYRGGLTLFGKNFGDFEQAIIMKIT
ncbi:MAG: transcriptional regulator, partial [Clostridia bacterium]|nr:transcriptional regulator [Clostridia bacterium]